jgi:regulator of sigma E protease
VDMCLNSAAWLPAFAFSLLEPASLLAVIKPEPTTLEWAQGLAWMIFQVGLGLGFVIFVHELGHFLVAKACGVKCDKFYIGFDVPMPKILGFQIPSKLVHFQWGETEYGIGILPLGGYVKMLGQDDDPRNAENESDRTKITNEQGQVVLDPRSFPAKSVPARMAIISAGVIMNLIFAVILAAVAYSLGVPEKPAVIGRTLPYGPAWAANIPPGSKVLQFGKGGEPYEYLSWENLQREVVLNGFDHKLPILVRTPEGEKKWFEIVPSDFLRSLSQPTLGVGQQSTRKIAPISVARAYLDAETDKPLADGDEVVAVAGQRLEADHHLNELLVQHRSGPLTITVARTEVSPGSSSPGAAAKTTEFDVVVSERPLRTLGLEMQIGPVSSIRAGSPAEKAGFMLGDVIEKVDGDPVGDPLSLGQRLTRAPGNTEPIKFTVSRSESEGKKVTKVLSVIPVLPKQLNDTYTTGERVLAASIESVGVAFPVTSVVSQVVPDSPAEKAGMQPGDTITHVQFIPVDEASRVKEAAALSADELEPIKLDTLLNSWPSIFARMQLSVPGTKVKLTYTRGKTTGTAEMTPVLSESFFDESRQLTFYGLKTTHQATDFADAVSLGLRETKDRLSEVVRVLGGLASFRIPVTSLSGPLGIVYAAGKFAEDGVPRTLIFLTLLSANLAVLNFLPIPALDGGHMLFLIAEWIRGKPVDERLQIRLTIAGVLALLSLMIFATAMDFDRFWG